MSGAVSPGEAAPGAASLVSPRDHWTIWACLVSAAALSIYLEQKNKIAQKITGPVIAIFAGMAFSNLSLLPAESASYDIVWSYLIPLVIPLLLMRMNILKVIRETGRMFVVFHFSSLGTVIGGFVAVHLLNRFIHDLPKIGAAMIASYIGGAINFVAMVETFAPDKDVVNATIVADNGVMALYFLFLIALPGIAFVRRIFPETELSRSFRDPGSEGGADAYWKPKPISLLNLAVSIALAFVIAMLAMKISGFFSEDRFPRPVRDVLGQKYLILTTLSISFPLLFPRFAEGLAGSDELGTFLIYMFFVLVGIPASLKTVIVQSPLLLLFCAIILAFNFVVTFGLGKVFGYTIEEMILCAVVSSGGPMNGAAISISKGWTKLILPSVLAGIWGYIIGNYVGFACGKALLHLLG